MATVRAIRLSAKSARGEIAGESLRNQQAWSCCCAAEASTRGDVRVLPVFGEMRLTTTPPAPERCPGLRP